MKTLIINLLLVGMIPLGHAQIVLKEAEVKYSRYSMEADPVTNAVTLEIKENHVGEFQEDPLAFIEDRFNIQQLVKVNEDRNFILYEVYFKTQNGNVLAKYDKDGEMVSTHQRFKNVALPDDVKLEILRNFRNSRILKSKHIVTSKNWLIDKEFFKVKIQDGDRVRQLKIERKAQGLHLAGL